MSLDLSFIPIAELIIAALSMYLTYRLNSANASFFLNAFLNILGENSARFKKTLWYLVFFAATLIGSYVAYKSSPANVTGTYLLKILDWIIGLLAFFGLITLIAELPALRKPNVVYAMSVLSVIILLVVLVLGWYLGFIMTLVYLASYVSHLPEPYSGLYVLIYYFVLVVSSFSIIFFILTWDLKSWWIRMADATISSHISISISECYGAEPSISGDTYLRVSSINSKGVTTVRNSVPKFILWNSITSLEIRKNETKNEKTKK